MGIFDEIIAKVADEDRAILDKYPEIKQAFGDAEAKSAAMSADLTKWKTWTNDYWDNDAGATKAEVALKAALENEKRAANEALARLQTMEQLRSLSGGSGETDMTFEEILENLDKTGKFVPASKIDEVVNARVQGALASAGFLSKKEAEEALAATQAGMQRLVATVPKLVVSHSKEFGNELDVEGLYKFMGDNRVYDPVKAYEDMSRPLREAARAEADKKREEEMQVKLDEARKEEREKVLQETALHSTGLPTDSGGNAVNYLSRRARQNDQDAPKIPEGAQLGDGVIAAVAAREIFSKTSGSSAAA